MKSNIRNSLVIGALTGAAAFISAHASGGRELVLSAPIQQLDRGTDTVTVLGQSFHAQTAQLSIGEVVRVYGTLLKNGSVKDAIVQGTDTFGTNGDPVFLKGVVSSTDPALGHARVDGMTVDYTSELANADFTAPNVGDVISLSGSQPAVKGVLVATATGPGAYAVAAQLTGGGFAAAQITGGGIRSAQITGGGINSAQITGGGVNSAQITGGGLRSAQITGGGLNSAQITGGGINSAQITGGGVRSAQITGGGVRAN